MENTKIAKAKKEESEALLKCFRRVEAYGPKSSLSFRLDETRILEDVNEERVYILKQNKRVLGAMMATSSWSNALFKQESSYKKEMEVLDAFAYQGERIVILDYLFVDPSFFRKKIGTSLMNTLLHHYEETTFLVCLTEEDCLPFFKKFGFRKLPLENLGLPLEKGEVYARPNQKGGLCSKPLF